jgi:hypothetical protein
MTQQKRRQGIALALTAMAAMLLALPGAAFAEKADRNDREHAKNERRYRGDDRVERNSLHAHDRNGRHESVADARHELRDARKDVAKARRNLQGARNDRRDDLRDVRDHRYDRRGFLHYVRNHRNARFDERHFARQSHKGHGHARHAKKHAQRAVFYCEPCSRRYSSRDELYGHAHRAHRVSFRRFTRKLVNHGVAWVFYG